MIKQVVILLLFFLAKLPADAQTTIVLQPNANTGKDAMLHGLPTEVNTNFGNDTQLPAEAWTFSGVFGVLRGLLEFDMTVIPQNATIVSAYLSLYANDATSGLGAHSTVGTALNDAWLERVTAFWYEDSVTWNNQPATTITNRVYVPPTTNPTQDYLNMDVTALTQDIFTNPAGNFGMMLKLDIEQMFRRLNFCTSDYADSSKHPKLEITYASPSGMQNVVNHVAFSITPNPFQNYIEINCAKNLPFEISIYDVTMRNVLQQKCILSTVLNTSILKQGIYFYSIRTQEGYIETGKLIKH